MPAPTFLAIAKVTGHSDSIKGAANTDYLDDLLARDNWTNAELGAPEIESLVDKPSRIYRLTSDGRLLRVPPEMLVKANKKGIRREVKTGKISLEYVDKLKSLLAKGERLFKRIVIGRKEIRDDHGFVLSRDRGTIVPMTFYSKMRAAELGWTEMLPRLEGNRLCGALLRDTLRGLRLHNHAVQIPVTGTKHGRSIASHNLVFAPSPKVLAVIKAQQYPIDSFLEQTARRALEKLERERNAKITCICSTHLQDSAGVRPHLHIRMISYDSTGSYIRLFDRTKGKAGSNRCILQDEMERQTRITLERWEIRTRER